MKMSRITSDEAALEHSIAGETQLVCLADDFGGLEQATSVGSGRGEGRACIPRIRSSCITSATRSRRAS
jgi:hypothetical protein